MGNCWCFESEPGRPVTLFLSCSMPKSEQRCSTNMSDSTKESRSSRSSTRSLAVSFPWKHRDDELQEQEAALKHPGTSCCLVARIQPRIIMTSSVTWDLINQSDQS